MGYFVTVEPGVKLYIEDINPGGSKIIVFKHGSLLMRPLPQALKRDKFNQLLP